MEILLEPKRVTRFFGIIVILLTLAHLAAQFSIYVLGYDNVFGLIHMFSLNAEDNIPALYSTVSLMFCSLLLALIALGRKRTDGRYTLHWAGLSAIFLFLGMDESLSFHESTTVPLRKSLNTSGVLFYAWIIPYAIALLILFFVYLRFLIDLKKQTRNQFILAGVIYVTGAMLFELPGGIYDAEFGRHNPVYALISTVEELLEMGGILVFIYALTSYLSAEFPRLRIGFSSEEETVKVGNALPVRETEV
jgi:uncharacterized BrkB/YihY/UPF0761 family membrane protein